MKDHQTQTRAEPGNRKLKIALVGNPNVGKSVVFNNLTGAHVTVSNYPGTTVDISRGTATVNDVLYEVVDTPGMYSFISITEEERIARSILLDEHPDIVVNIVDSRNLQRMLVLTLQLIEAGLPVVLMLNMMDEAEAAGITIDARALEERLGVRVVEAVATSGKGMTQIREIISSHGVFDAVS